MQNCIILYNVAYACIILPAWIFMLTETGPLRFQKLILLNINLHTLAT